MDFKYQQYTPEEIKNFEIYFKQFYYNQTEDANNQELLSFDQVSSYSSYLASHIKQLYQRVSKFALEKDGTINYEQLYLSLISFFSNEDKFIEIAFKFFDIKNDGYISNGELFHSLKMMAGNNINEVQLQQIIDRTIVKVDLDFDGKISFEEFKMIIKKKGVYQNVISPLFND